MTVFRLLIIFCTMRLCWPLQYRYWNKYHIWDTTLKVPAALINVMKTYHQNARVRSTELNEMRFMYEESPHYEEGYVMSELVDRYKKMVYHVKHPMEHQSDNVFETLRHLELVEHLGQEIYHLSHMIHEIPRKYRQIPEFANLEKEIDMAKVQEEMKNLKEQERLQKREKKKAAKVLKKLRELAMAQGQKVNYPPKIRNKWWPIDYGWEIDYYW
ncbi:uncharacterized protein LOC135085305 [Ostrinia nubilalis]|uniref:uncharacterized protein LOC135085305 n=1 Tax=Ostrinia nubilalis TaxID=29057 RepID=UPI00308220DB